MKHPVANTDTAKERDAYRFAIIDFLINGDKHHRHQ